MAKLKEVISELDGAINHRFRLGIMSVLLHTEWAEFNVLKTTLGLTDGNLASHLKGLEKIEYVVVRKKFVGRKPNTAYRLTERGKRALARHNRALAILVSENQKALP